MPSLGSAFDGTAVGDRPYESHSWVKSKVQVDAGVNIVRGGVYTKDSAGRLIAPPTASGVPNLNPGIFQALEDSLAVASETAGSRDIQCYIPPSFIVLLLPANIEEGNRVGLAGAGSTADVDKVVLQNDTTATNFLGRVHDIFAETSTGGAKLTSANNDHGVIFLGGGA